MLPSIRRSCWIALGLFLLALAPRLPGLDVFLTADEPKAWFGRSIQFLDALARGDWSATYDSPAPGVTTMWAGALGLLLEYLRRGDIGAYVTDFLQQVPFDPLDPAILPLIRLPIVLLVALAASLTYLWSRSFLGDRVAVLAACLLAFDPFLLALSRVLGHDALVAVFMWLSLLALLHAWHGTGFTRPLLTLSGALGGLAFLTKYPSLLLGAFTLAIMLAMRLRRRQSLRHLVGVWLLDGTVWWSAAAVTFVILWPAMWIDAPGRLAAIFNDAVRASGTPHPKGSFFMGQPVPDPGLGFYGLVTLFRTTPLLWLGWLLLVAGVLTRSVAQQGSQLARIALVLILYALTYGLLVTLGGKKQDRYILPAFPALATLAALGYGQIAEWVRNPGLRCGLLTSIVVAQAVLVLPHFPYYFTYYNPLMGGGAAAVQSVMVGWGEGLDQAARYLNTLPDATELRVVAWYSTTFEPYFHGKTLYKVEEEKISRTPKPGLAADYVVLYINQVQRELPSAGALQFFRAATPVYTVTLHGIDYAWIHPAPAVEHIIPGDVRLVGQGELLGYDLRDETGRSLSSVRPDSVAYLSLYWEWQGKSLNDPLRISLVDEGGKTCGWGHHIRTVAPLPPEAWQEGMVVRDDFALAIFADTPPGDYRLAAWIDRPATGETVGVFPTEGISIRVNGKVDNVSFE
ncbi:MAG: glycosyltransferase family 39 protein [Anaerolineae bacterium]|nr:glycosyltransferase family 39 protein [Anaerolineae bacterium]MDW8070448.1 glycosyltransferase family 39 protein [Anaerolineae bacterium]